MTYQLLALDMDGTLLDSRKRITPRTREALAELAGRGVPVAFCTGRCVCELMEYPAELPFVRFGVLSSGAVLYDFARGHSLEVHGLDAEVLVEALRIARREDVMEHMMSVGASIVRPEVLGSMERYHMGVYTSMFQRICTPVRDLETWVLTHPGEVVKTNFYHVDPDARSRTRRRLLEAGLPLALADAETTSIECSAHGVSKGRGIRALCARLGIDVGRVVAVGDSDNDLEALRAVGMPVAMGNATPAIRAVARLVVADNDHDGVVEVIDRLF